MIQSVNSATSVAALNAATTKAAVAKAKPAAVPAVDPAKAVSALKAADAKAFMQRQQIGAALYDRSFTYDEGIRALKRQDAIAAYATKIQSQEGGPTEKQLAALARKQERADAQIQRLSTNGKGADLNSIKAVDGKVVDDTQANLAARIAQGVKDGTLTTDEVKTLSEQQTKIAELEKGLRESGGKLTAGEQKMVLDELRKSADAINKARGNNVGVAASTITYADRVNERQAALEKQLEAGLKAGSLTEEEAATVRKQFDVVNAAEKEALVNGSINWREATSLSSLMNEAEAQIYELQRNDAGKKLAEVYVNPDYVDQRQTGQLEGIARGIDNRSLTNEEAATLLQGQQAVDDQQAKAVEGGLTRAEYLRLQSTMNDQSLAANALASNAVRYTGLIPRKADEVIASVKPVVTPPVSGTPGSSAGAAGGNAGTPGSSAGAAGGNAGTPGSSAGAAGGNAGTPGSSAGAAGGNAGTPGSSAGAAGGNAGTPGSSAGAAGGNAGTPGSSAGAATQPPVSTAPSTPVDQTPATPAPATPVASTPAAPEQPAAPAASEEAKPPVVETPASEVKAELAAETQPTTVQINKELANHENLLPKLLAKMMEEQRANLQRYAEQLAEKADEGKRQAAREGERREAGKSEVHAPSGSDRFAPRADIVAKVSSYARTDAAASVPSTPVLAKKVA